MNDDQMAKFIPLCGDRLAVRNFLSQQKLESANASPLAAPKRKLSVLDRLRKRLCLPHGNDVQGEETETRQFPPKSSSVALNQMNRASRKRNAQKTSRVIELRWIIIDTSGNRKKVNTENGGGTRKVEVRKDSTVDDIFILAKDYFFPQKLSDFGHIDSFKCSIWDFKLCEMNSVHTVGYLYESSKLSMLRFYLVTTAQANDDVSERQHVELEVNVDSTEYDNFLPGLQDLFGTSSSEQTVLLYHIA